MKMFLSFVLVAVMSVFAGGCASCPSESPKDATPSKPVCCKKDGKEAKVCCKKDGKVCCKKDGKVCCKKDGNEAKVCCKKTAVKQTPENAVPEKASAAPAVK